MNKLYLVLILIISIFSSISKAVTSQDLSDSMNNQDLTSQSSSSDIVTLADKEMSLVVGVSSKVENDSLQIKNIQEFNTQSSTSDIVPLTDNEMSLVVGSNPPPPPCMPCTNVGCSCNRCKPNTNACGYPNSLCKVAHCDTTTICSPGNDCNYSPGGGCGCGGPHCGCSKACHNFLNLYDVNGIHASDGFTFECGWIYKPIDSHANDGFHNGCICQAVNCNCCKGSPRCGYCGGYSGCECWNNNFNCNQGGNQCPTRCNDNYCKAVGPPCGGKDGQCPCGYPQCPKNYAQDNGCGPCGCNKHSWVLCNGLHDLAMDGWDPAVSEMPNTAINPPGKGCCGGCDGLSDPNATSFHRGIGCGKTAQSGGWGYSSCKEHCNGMKANCGLFGTVNCSCLWLTRPCNGTCHDCGYKGAIYIPSCDCIVYYHCPNDGQVHGVDCPGPDAI